MNVANSVKDWLCFFAWLVWFVLTMPWQLQKAYGQVMNAITFNNTFNKAN